MILAKPIQNYDNESINPMKNNENVDKKMERNRRFIENVLFTVYYDNIQEVVEKIRNNIADVAKIVEKFFVYSVPDENIEKPKKKKSKKNRKTTPKTENVEVE